MMPIYRIQRSHTYFHAQAAAKSPPFPVTNKPVIRPKSPRTELKISTTKIFTNLFRYKLAKAK